MLRCVFYSDGGELYGFTVSGHAGYETENGDVVCAAVSSCVMLVCNTITDFFKAKAEVTVLENEITLKLLEENKPSRELLAAFYNHIGMIAEEHKKIKTEIKSGGK